MHPALVLNLADSSVDHLRQSCAITFAKIRLNPVGDRLGCSRVPGGLRIHVDNSFPPAAPPFFCFDLPIDDESLIAYS